MTFAVEVDLTGKVILITGAAGGIGQSLVNRALAAEANVAAFDLKEVAGDHPQLLKLQGDATNEQHVADAVAQIANRWNRLDALINNVGKVGGGRVETMTLADWRSMLDANLTSAFLFSRQTIPLLKQSRGAIVRLSSTNGLTGGSHLSGAAYAAAKAGVIALTKNLARELASSGVRANAIAPGPIDTPMLDRLSEAEMQSLRASIPLGEIGSAEDVTNLALFLISNAARHITGVTISLSGGLVVN